MNHGPILIRRIVHLFKCSMCVGPGSVTREEFFSVVSSALQGEETCATDVNVIDTAYVCFSALFLDLCPSSQ